MQRRLLSWVAQMGLVLCGVLLSGAAFHAGAQALQIGGTGSALEGDMRSCAVLAHQVYHEFNRAEIEFQAYL